MTIKQLNQKDLEEMSITDLYNILFGPIIDGLKDLNNHESIVTVYGATVYPIFRRITALEKLISENENIKTIVLSGGAGWTGLGSNPTKEKITSSASRINTRAKDIEKLLPEVKDDVIALLNELNPMWLQNLYEQIKCQLYDNEDFRTIVDKLYQDQNSTVSFSRWLLAFTNDYAVRQYLNNQIQEATIMYSKLLHDNPSIEQNHEIILDDNSINTKENAYNTIMEYQKAKEKNPRLDTIIVINEWPYLQRAVQTTKKVAQELGISVNIVGYPACWSKEIEWQYSTTNDIRYNPVSGMIVNLLKMVNYEDSEDYDISPYLGLDSMIEGGPDIKVKNELGEYIDLKTVESVSRI